MDETNVGKLPECENCGAKLPPPTPDGTRTCGFCEAVYHPPTPKAPPQMAPPPNLGGWSGVNVTVVQGTQSSYSSPVVRPSGKSGCGAGAIITFIVILAGVIGIPIYLAARLGGTFSTLLADKPAGPLAVAPPGSGPPTAIYTLLQKRSGTSTVYAVARLNPPSSSPVWTSNNLTATSPPAMPVLTDGTTVVVADGMKISAFRADSGAPAWTVPLTDELTSNCDACFFLAGNRLIVKPKDATFHAIDTATGAVAWKRKAFDVSAYALPYGDKTMLFDYTDGENHDTGVYLVDPDGTENLTQPTCPSQFSTPEAFETSATVIPLPEENAAVFGFGDAYPCWQRFDFATGQPTWLTEVESGQRIDRSDLTYAKSGTKVVVAGRELVATLDLGTGEYKPLPEIADTELHPIGIREDTVILDTLTQRGTPKHAIHAIDTATGQEKWAIDLGKAEPADGPKAETIFLGSGDSRYTTSVDGDTFRMVVFDHDSRQLQLTNVTISSGQQAKSVTDSGIGDSLPEFDAPVWRGATVVLSFEDAGIAILDTTTSQVTFRYP